MTMSFVFVSECCHCLTRVTCGEDGVGVNDRVRPEIGFETKKACGMDKVTALNEV